MDIVKNTDNTVSFYVGSVAIATLQEDVTASLNKGRNGIEIIDIWGKRISFFTTDIENTQKLPAAAVKTQPITTVELWDLMFDPNTTPFFDELSLRYLGGGGPVIETNWTFITTPTTAYTLLSTDYQIWITTNCTITIPTAASLNVGQVFRLFIRDVTVVVKTSGGELLDGKTSRTYKKYSQITIRMPKLGVWGIGD